MLFIKCTEIWCLCGFEHKEGEIDCHMHLREVFHGLPPCWAPCDPIYASPYRESHGCKHLADSVAKICSLLPLVGRAFDYTGDDNSKQKPRD